MVYIPASKHHTLHQFKYTGGTDSITYQYLWSPLAEYLLKSVPLWMAPNLITLIALLMLLVCNAIFMLPDEGDVIPSWKFVLMAVSIIIYQNLDNIDGKQARRTKSSSPLGMLFDHGADALSSFLLGVQVMKILQLSPSFQLFTIFSFIMGSYFCAMWSQYCVGMFKLSRVNPVDEGLPFYSICCLVATQIDLGFMNDYHLIGTIGEQMIYGMVFLLIPVCVFMTKDILKNAIVPKKDVIFMPLLYVSTGIALFLVNEVMIEWNRVQFYCFFYALAFMWSRNMINIQLYFITKQKFRVFNRGTLSFLLPCLFFFLFHQKLDIDAETYFFCLFILELVILLEFVCNVFNDGAKILGIWLFSLKAREKQGMSEGKMFGKKM